MPRLPLPATLDDLLRGREERLDLGVHANHHLRARVRHRALRLALGRRRRLAFEFGYVRPVAVEVTAGADTYNVRIPTPFDPWLRLTWRLALLTIAAATATHLLSAYRRDPRGAQP